MIKPPSNARRHAWFALSAKRHKTNTQFGTSSSDRCFGRGCDHETEIAMSSLGRNFTELPALSPLSLSLSVNLRTAEIHKPGGLPSKKHDNFNQTPKTSCFKQNMDNFKWTPKTSGLSNPLGEPFWLLPLKKEKHTHPAGPPVTGRKKNRRRPSRTPRCRAPWRGAGAWRSRCWRRAWGRRRARWDGGEVLGINPQGSPLSGSGKKPMTNDTGLIEWGNSRGFFLLFFWYGPF